MGKITLLFLLFFTTLFGAHVDELRWENGETFLTFLEKHSIPSNIYYGLDREDQELVTEIRATQTYHILKDSKDEFEQALIPISEEMQIHIFKDNDSFRVDIIPINYETRKQSLTLSLQSSPYQDILDATGNIALASEFILTYGNSIDFRRDLQKDDKLAIIYSQKYRLGKLFGEPKIEASMIETRGKDNYLFLYSDSRYYNEKGVAIDGSFLKVPLDYKRISSKFSLKRWHPVLKKYRAHLGVDYAAPRGTHVKSAGNGRVIFKGRKGGYGKTVIIAHDNGYKTLYAHLKSYKSGIRKGKKVKQGQLIGYVGSTGLSTGPHLHFGVYKNSRPVNPANAVKTYITKKLSGKKKIEFLAMASEYQNSIQSAIDKNLTPQKIKKDFIYLVKLDNTGSIQN